MQDVSQLFAAVAPAVLPLEGITSVGIQTKRCVNIQGTLAALRTGLVDLGRVRVAGRIPWTAKPMVGGRQKHRPQSGRLGDRHERHSRPRAGLDQAGAIKGFTDVRSGRSMDRPGLSALLDYARISDT